MTARTSLELTKLESPSYEIGYRLPLSGDTQTWATSDFDQFLRKYIALTMAKVFITKLTIKWERIKK